MAIFGSITDALGLTDYKGEKVAREQAAATSKQSLEFSKESIALAKENIDFQKQQYQDFQNVYGDLQTNLGNYYRNLTPDKLIALGLENQQKEYQAVDASIRRDFAQRGLDTSGIEAATTSDLAFKNASVRAAIRTNAPQTVAEEKLKFLGIGLGQGAALLGNIGTAASTAVGAGSNAAQTRAGITSNYLTQQTNFSTRNQAGTANFLSNVGSTFAPKQPSISWN